MTTTEREAQKVIRKSVEVAYRPRYWALKMHDDKRLLTKAVRWIVLVIHRRGGKTTAAFNHLQRDAMRYANTRYAYIAPTYRQAKRIVWKMAKQYALAIDGVKFNESELLITYPNGSEILILGAQQADGLRGIGLWGCFLDEYPLMSPLVFTEIITKCLADHLGYCIFGGTPKGKGHFFRVFQVAQKETKGWLLVYRTIEESLEQEGGETVDNLRTALEDDKALVKQGLMTQEEFEQEWHNSFEAAIRGAVYLTQITGMRKGGRVKKALYDKTLPVYTVWDLGISKSDAMAVGFYQRVGKELRKVDYLETVALGLPETIKQVKARGYTYARHFAPHDIKHKELGTGKSRLDTAEKLGIVFEVVPSLSIEDGIDVAREAMTRLWVDPDKCDLWLDFIGQYHYEFDEKKGMFTKRPVHDFTSHGADEWRYAAICEEYMEPLEVAVGKTTQQDEPEVADEFEGTLEEEHESQTGMGKHPVFRGVNIGAMGHKKPGEK